MILYKYTDIMTALEIIINSTVKFTFPNNFNDPLQISTCSHKTSDIKTQPIYLISISSHTKAFQANQLPLKDSNQQSHH